MVDIDHSVVYRRDNGKRGSGTVVHFASNFLILEVYEKTQEIRLNEVFGNVRVSLGQVIFYDGKAVVCEVIDSSSIQLVTLYLRDSCIAVGASNCDSENQFALERFLQVYLSPLTLPSGMGHELFQFADFLSQLMLGLKVSKLQNQNTLHFYEVPSVERSRMRLRNVDVLLKRLTEQYDQLCQVLESAGEDEKLQIGDFFKRFIFPLSVSSKLFRYFHASARSSYINYPILQRLRLDGECNRGSLSGYLLDEFFKTCAGFQDFEKRCNHWVKVIQEWLATHEGNARILMLGSDLTPIFAINSLSESDQSRLEFDIYCSPADCPEVYESELRGLVSQRSQCSQIRFIQAPVRELLSLYFQQKTGAFLTYDCVFSTSFLESLSCKSAAYVIGFCLLLLREEGRLYVFSGKSGYSPIRQHWLLWFEHRFEMNDWKRYLPSEPVSMQTQYEYGQLTIFESISDKS